jgi:hypothetical protein
MIFHNVPSLFSALLAACLFVVSACLTFYPEYGGYIFLREVRPFPNYMALQVRDCTLHSHCCENLKANSKAVIFLQCPGSTLSLIWDNCIFRITPS